MTDKHQYSHISAILTNPAVLRDASSFFDLYQAPVRRFFQHLCNNASEADDQFQEFAVKFLSGGFDSYNPNKGRFRDYLKTSLRNQVFRTYRRQPKDEVAFTDELQAALADPKDSDPIQRAFQEFDSAEGTQIKMAVDEAMEVEESEGRHQFFSLLQFAIQFQRDRLAEGNGQIQGRAKVPVSAFVDFYHEKFGETITKDTAKQRVRRAKAHYADLMLSMLGVHIGDSSPDALRLASNEMGLSVYVGKELERRMAQDSE